MTRCYQYRAWAIITACVLWTSFVFAWTEEELLSARRSGISSSNVIPGRYILEFHQGESNQRRDIAARAASVVGQVASLGYDAAVRVDYSAVSSRFEGLSIEIANHNTSAAADLKSLPDVADVWPVEVVTLDATINTTTGIPLWNPHASTRIDELHQRGLTGQGQRVCVIDTGVDASHPALAGKIAGGISVMEDTSDLSDCVGHGTFVSSVIVGENKDFVGVAPHAEIYMYRIFPCSDTTSTDFILKGLLTADKDGCDIISMSVGSDTGYSGAPSSRVASAISQERLVVIAAGNSGEMGPFYGSSPAAGTGVVAVASSKSKQTMAWPATIRSSGGETLEIKYVTPTGAQFNETVEVSLVFDGADSCNPGVYGDSDQAVVIKRGICVANKGYNTATSMGFGYYILYDSYNQGVYYMSDVTQMDPVHLFAVTEASVGNWTSTQIGKGYNLTLEIVAGSEAVPFDTDRPNSGQMSYYTSWGPTFENDFFPSITAPGGAVYGAQPDNSYAIGSGTSFSTPYIAGVAAIFYSSIGKDFDNFKARLYSTASALPAFDESEAQVLGNIAPLAQQGTGLVDAVKLFDYHTVVQSNPLISLNDTDHRVSSHTVRIQNSGPEEVTYNITHLPASTVQSKGDYMYIPTYFPPLLSGVEGSIIAPESINLSPGESKDVQIIFNSPSTDGALWSGKVVFAGDNDEAVSVAYQGIEASTYNWTAFPAAIPVFRYDSNDGYLYPINWGNKPYRPAELDSPEIYYVLRYGTYEYSFDIVGPDWTTESFEYPPIASTGPSAWYGPILTQPDVNGNTGEFPATFPVRFSGLSFFSFQSFGNGTKIPSGQYKILSRALHMFGDASNNADWQLYLTDPFWIQLGDDPIPGYNNATVTTTSLPLSTRTGESNFTLPGQTGITLSESSPAVITSSPIVTQPDTTATTDYTSSIATQTSRPGFTTTLVPVTQPTGVANVFSGISVNLLQTTSQYLYDPASWLELHVQMFIPTRLYDDTVISFSVPLEITDLATKAYVQDGGGNLVGSTAFNYTTGSYEITFSSWADWHSDITGDFYLPCRFSSDYLSAMKEGTYVIEIATPGQVFRPELYYRAVDRSTLYESKHTADLNEESVFFFVVEVPGSLGPWESVTLTTTQNEDDGYLCNGTSVHVGTKFNDANQIIDFQDVTTQSVQRCEVKHFKATYSASIESNEVLQFNIAAIQGIKGYSSISVVYDLTILLLNGTTVSFSSRSMTYYKDPAARPDAFFNGVRDTTGPIQGGTSVPTSTILSTTSSSTSTVTTVTSTQSTTLGSSLTSTSSTRRACRPRPTNLKA